MRKTMETSHSSVPAEVWTKHLPNRRQSYCSFPLRRKLSLVFTLVN